MTTRRRPKPSGRRNDTEELILQVGQMPFSNGCLESPNTGHRPSTIADEAEPMRTRPSDEGKEHDIKEASADCPSEDEQHMSQVERPLIHNTAVIPEAQGQQNEINRDNTTILKTIEKQEKAREEETKLQHNIEQIMKECSGLRKCNLKRTFALSRKQSDLDKNRTELQSLQEEIESKNKSLREYKVALRTNEKDVSDLKVKNSTLEEKMSDLNHENLQMCKEVNQQLERYHKQVETIQQLSEEKSRQVETIQQLSEEKSRQVETIQQLSEEKSRKDDTIQRLNEKNFRQREANQKLKIWLMVCLLICIALDFIWIWFKTTQLSTEVQHTKSVISIEGNTFIYSQ